MLNKFILLFNKDPKEPIGSYKKQMFFLGATE